MKKELLAGVISAGIVLGSYPAAALGPEDMDAESLDTQETWSEQVESLNLPENELIVSDVVEEPESEEEPADDAAETWYNAEDDVFTISTAEQFFELAEIVNSGTDDFKNKTVQLGSDIDLDNAEWTPIGGTDTGKSFAGTFDGGGHTISNLKITRENANKAQNNRVGLFGSCTSAAKLQNFTLYNVDVTGCLNVAAVLGGNGVAEAKISDVHVSGNVQVSGWWYVGGILGKGYTTITDCSVEGDSPKTSYVSINGGYVGGIVGFMGEGNCKTIGCTVENLTVEGADNGIGGINGILHYGNTIQDCTATNVIVWQTSDAGSDGRIYAGAFAGTYLDNNGKTPPTLDGCEFTGEIYSGAQKNDILEANRYVGSLWYGAEPPATVHITDCKIHMPPVAQVGGVTYESLKEAIEQADAKSTVYVLRDVTLDTAIDPGKEIVIEGKTKSNGSKPIIQASGANGLFSQSGSTALTLRNLELKAVVDDQWYICHSANTLTISKCDFTTTDAVSYIGNVVMGEGNPSADANYALIFTDNTITANARTALTGLGNGSVVTGNLIDLLQEKHGDSDDRTSILSLAAAANGEDVTIQDNTFKNANCAITVDTATLSADAIHITNNQFINVRYAFAFSPRENAANGTYDMSHNYYIFDNTVSAPKIQDADSDGDKFSFGDGSAEYLPAGESQVVTEPYYLDESCTILSNAVAMVNGVAYNNLSEAIAAANAGDTVKVLKKVTIMQPLTIDRDITVTGFANISVADTGSLTISAGRYDADPNAYLASGYQADLVDGLYTVRKVSSDGGASHPSTGGSSSSSGSSGNKTESTENADGSTTTIVTRPDGSKTETTKYEDGSKEVIQTDKNGNTTTTYTDSNGNKTQTIENTDGSSKITVDNVDGSSSTTTINPSGQVETSVSLSDQTLEDAAARGQAAKLPMPEASASSNRENAPTITVSLPTDAAKVEIPVEDVTPGTVAVLVKADGTEQIIKTSLTTENGVLVTLSDGG